MSHMTVHEIEVGSDFIWNTRRYTLIRWEDDDQTAIVKEVGHEYEERFNPYAHITKG